jgi:hypothetical protein
MLIKPPILSRENRLDEMGGHLIQGNDSSMFLILGEEGAEGTIVAIAKFYCLVNLGEVLRMNRYQISGSPYRQP